jgi:DNA-binding MarR family transcriptional regulator
MIPMPSYVFTVQSDYDKLIKNVEHQLKCGKHDLTPAAALLIAFLGDSMLTMTEMVKLKYYIGYNPVYNIRHLEQGEYITREPVKYDKRKIAIVLTAKGRLLAEQIRKALGGEEGRVAA